MNYLSIWQVFISVDNPNYADIIVKSVDWDLTHVPSEKYMGNVVFDKPKTFPKRQTSVMSCNHRYSPLLYWFSIFLLLILIVLYLPFYPFYGWQDHEIPIRFSTNDPALLADLNLEYSQHQYVTININGPISGIHSIDRQEIDRWMEG